MLTEISRKAYSGHPDDWYLAIVLSINEEFGRQEWCTHLENSSGSKSFKVEGHYFSSFTEAFADYNNRGRF
jgi:hypothetical protein